MSESVYLDVDYEAWNPLGYVVGPFRERGAQSISNVIVIAEPSHPYLAMEQRLTGRGACFRCAELNSKPMHITYFMGHGCFPLCEECWQALTPEQRVPFYTMLWAVWVGQTPQEIDDYISQWPAMCAAVLAGG